MSQQTFKKFISLFSVLVILINTLIPALNPLQVHAETPPPPTPPALTPPPSGGQTGAAGLSTQSRPTPNLHNLPPDIEQALVRRAMEATLEKYQSRYGTPVQLDAASFKMEGGRAYATAGPDTALPLLAQRQPDGAWQVLLPDGDPLFDQWLEAAPERLISAGEKGEIRRQVDEMVAQRQLPGVSALTGQVDSGVNYLDTETPTLSQGSNALINIQATTVISDILSNGQFVYGPNIGTFEVDDYLRDAAPHLLPYAQKIYERSEYYSINPKVYLTLMEMSSQLISNKEATPNEIENPFGLKEFGLITQLDYISDLLFEAYYFHLYQISPLPVDKRELPNVTLADDSLLEISPTINAGSYAVIVALAPLRDAAEMEIALDKANQNSFYQTYLALFPNDDPLDDSNHIYIPGEVGALAAPAGLLQLPYLRGESWKFNGVHDALGGDYGSPGTDMSSIDFSPGWPGWNADTSNMWVAAAASGTPTKISSCNFKITHSDGWETTYYHLETIQSFGSSIQQNDKIGVIANTYAEATCNGGNSTGPHVHFTLKRNGARIPIDDTDLSGWYVHSGRSNYDYDPNYMWLERNGTKKYVGDSLLNDGGNSGGTLDPPTLNSPSEGQTLNNRLVHFTWQNPNSTNQNGYTFRLSTSSNPDAQPWIKDTGLGNEYTSYDYSLPSDGTFYWHMRTWNSSGQASNWITRRFVIDTSSPPPPPAGKWNAKYYIGHDCWNDTGMSCTDSNMDYKDDILFPGDTRLIDKEWTGKPGGSVGDDNWTGLFETTVNFPTDEYVFYVTYDDAVRVDINGLKGPWEYNGYNPVLICNGDHGFNLSGNVPIKIYLKEYGGEAYIKLQYSTDTSVCTPAPPAAPTLQSPTNDYTFNEGDNITLAWSNTGNDYYGEVWGGPAGTLTFDWQSSTSKYIGSQWAGYTYSWHVKARNSGGQSGWSSTRTFKVRPAAPSNLSGQTASCSQINLTWTNNSGSQEGFKIYRNGAYLDTVTTTSYQDTGLSETTGYSYYIKTYRGSIESNASNTINVTTPPCPSPQPDLVPTQWSGWQYPIVPSSIADTSSVNTLYAGYPTYIDWGLTNNGDASTGGNSFGVLYLDGAPIHTYDFGDVQPGQEWAFRDITRYINTPGWHTLKVLVDPDNLIAESDETNNTWEHQFYWVPAAPYSDDIETGVNNWTATGLWHQVSSGDTYATYHSSSHSWWYGQNATGNYNTGAANSGNLTSPSVYIPLSGYYLRFWYRSETEYDGPDWDQRWLQISVDSGPFENVLQLYDDPMNWWLQSPAIDLSAYAGHTIKARFRFDTIGAYYNDYRGWYVDDFEISNTPPPNCADGYETNNTMAQATPLAYGQSRNANLCPNGDYDFYKFAGAAGDKVVVDIDAEVNGSSLDSYLFLLDSNGTALSINDDEILGDIHDSHLGYTLPNDGTYYIKVIAWDHPSAGDSDYFYTIRLSTDFTDPSSVQIITPTYNSWLNPTLQTIAVSALDNQSGVRMIEFWWHDADWDNSDWVWLGNDEDSRDGWSIDLDTSGLNDQDGGAVYAFAYDWVWNYTGAGVWELGLDRTLPTVNMGTDLLYGDAPFVDFYVWWSGYDDTAGVANYDIQFRDGPTGVWTDLLTGTTDTYYRFVGQNEHTYYFRVRAQDEAGNQSPYTGDNGDAWHTVQICAASADLYEADNGYSAANSITTDGSWQAHNFDNAGDQDWLEFTATAGVTYTLSTANTGGHADTMISLYDANGTTLLGFNDDDPDNWPASRLEWGATKDGTYFVTVEHWDPYAYGCTTAYQVLIEETGAFELPANNRVFLPVILR